MITFNEYLAGVINNDREREHSLMNDITQQINKIIENINEALENPENSVNSTDNKTSSVLNFFKGLKNKTGIEVKEMPTEQIKERGEEALKKMETFRKSFEARYPEVAKTLAQEAKNDATSLKGDMPLTTESVAGILGKGVAMIGAGLSWAAWNAIKFTLLQMLKVAIKIAKNIFTTHGKGILTFITICGAIIFPWLGFVQEPIFLIPSAIYYLVMIIGTLFNVGD